jgi:hypothetical protein
MSMSAKSRLSLQFDETVRFRVAYSTINTGGNGAQVWANNVIHNLLGSGVAEYETNAVSIDVRSGSGGTAWADGNPNTPNIPSSNFFANPFNGQTVLWSFSELDKSLALFGETFLNYIKSYSSYVPTDDGEPPVSTDPDDSAGVNLTMPIVGGLGHTGKIFGGIPTQVQAGPSAGARVTGYTVNSEHAPLTSIVIPSQPEGGENLSISFNEQTLPLVAGQEIDFGPDGAQRFTISGFDPTAPDFTAADLVMGLQFAEEGLASLAAVPILFIPPGDHNENGLVDAADYVVWRKNGGAQDVYDTWRANFGQPSGGATEPQSPVSDSAEPTSAAVPEPATLAILLTAILADFTRRRTVRSNRGAMNHFGLIAASHSSQS